MTKITPVVLAGGSGARLWPLSNCDMPKQFAPLMSSRSMFQETVSRFADSRRFERPVIVCADRYVSVVRRQLSQIGCATAQILVETAARDSGPAVAVAAIHAARSNPEAALLIAPSDHRIGQAELFRETVSDGLELAELGSIVIFGVEPTRAETGYGYIKAGERLWSQVRAHEIEHFVEKPNRKTAEEYLADGGYFWNSGMVLAKASRLIEAFRECAEPILSGSERAIANSMNHRETVFLPRDVLSDIPKISFDNAVLEHISNIALIPVQFDWSDLGDWAAVSEATSRDSSGNTCIGDAMLLSSRGVYCRTEGLKIAAIGVEDLVIVANGDGVLVTRKDLSQRVRDIHQ